MPLSLCDAPMLESTSFWSQELMMCGEARGPLQPDVPLDAPVDGRREPGRFLPRNGHDSAPSLLASGQGWKRVCDDAVPESPTYTYPAVPDAPAMQPLVLTGLSLEEVLAMYKHKARMQQLESGDLAALAAAAGNAAAAAVLSAVQNARGGAAVRLLASILLHMVG